MTDEASREVNRVRWGRAREALKLVDCQGGDVATGGLGRHVEHLSVRLLILLGEPEHDVVDFDQRLWSWLKSDFESPFEGQPTDWGQHTLPTTAAAVRCLQISAERWSWDSYLAFYRHGGLDMAFGVEGGRDIDGNRRAFWLLRIVGRSWAARHLYGDAIRRFRVKGPWGGWVALRKTFGAALGDFGAGWAEYGDPRAHTRPCPEPNLLWRRELDTWLGPEETKQLAFAIGSQSRRFLARDGRLAGQFDWRRYR